MDFLSGLHISYKSIAAYFINFLICVFLLIVVLQLWNADLSIPLTNSGDATVMNMWVKGLIDNGWWFENPYLGMPFGQENYDFPLTNTLDLLLIKFFGLLTNNFGMTMNLFYLSTFPLTALVAMFAFRRFDISYGCSILGSILFAFAPFHFLRGEPHIFFASFFLIPLGIMVILWILEGNALVFNYKNNKFEIFENKKVIFSIIICILMACNLYYAFFICFFLLVSGIALSIDKKDTSYLISSIFYIFIIVGVLLLFNFPSLLYQHQNGSNPDAIYRFPEDAEIYGLKIVQLLFPLKGHRIPFLAAISEKYNSSAPLVNENSFAALGIFGSIGFLILIAWIILGIVRNQKKKLSEFQIKINNLGFLNILAVLLATIGGFGSVFAYLIFYDIRAYNRISIFIAFFSIFALILLLESFRKRYSGTTFKQYLFIGLIGVILIFGVYDQTTPGFIPNYPENKIAFEKYNEITRAIESDMPDRGMIFQLPYIQYMGWGPSSARLPMYTHGNLYLHSKTLRWSYGGMVNREADIWQRYVTDEPPDRMIKDLSLAGFDGILLDSNGYPDGGVNEKKALSDTLETKPIISSDQRFYFYNMSRYNQKIKTNYSAEQFKNEQTKILNPIIITWKSGFYPLESNSISSWRYGSSHSIIEIINPYKDDQIINIDTIFVTGYPENSKLSISGDIISADLIINNSGTVFNRTLTIPPGKHLIEFTCDAKRIYAPNDPRYLVYSVTNFHVDAENFVIYK